ncbi:MAG: cobalamin-independent methionine synthase II family protein [Steroidobacteraceae bacterium]
MTGVEPPARIRTTHVGSLPGPLGFDPTAAISDEDLRNAVAWVVREQRSAGIDLVNEGELTKGGDWLAYMERRLGGFEARAVPNRKSIMIQGRDRETFAEFYRWAAERQTLFFTADKRMQVARRYMVCTGPIVYTGAQALSRELEILRSVATDPASCFVTSTAPSSLEPYRGNEFYRTEEEYVAALAEAMRAEYEAIARAGFVVQIDDAWLIALWDRIGIAMGLAEFKKRSLLRVEALNHALAGIPEEQIRYHLCWGSWHGPHAYDLPFAEFVEVMLAVKARYYSFEAANVRHEHEYAIWEDVKLPGDKVILPGVVTHATDLVEHPALVAHRIERFARLVGPERVIASTDCGFGGRIHPQIAWAKLRALAEGAALASRKLAV